MGELQAHTLDEDRDEVPRCASGTPPPALAE
jgi:hypothetical protein